MTEGWRELHNEELLNLCSLKIKGKGKVISVLSYIIRHSTIKALWGEDVQLRRS